MKSATTEQVPKQWAEILRWVVAGEEVQVTERDKVVARLLPPAAVQSPDFVGRAKAVWGDAPAGQSLSTVVSDAREAIRDLSGHRISGETLLSGAGQREGGGASTGETDLAYAAPRIGVLECFGDEGFFQNRDRRTSGCRSRPDDDGSEGRRAVSPAADWAGIFSEAIRLAEQYTPSIGCRSLDILHCAAAKVLGASEFVSGDLRQGKLATAMGLNLVTF